MTGSDLLPSDLLLWYARRGWVEALRKSAYRKFCRRHHGERRGAKTVFGAHIEVQLGDSVDNAIYVHGRFEPTTTEVFQRLAPHVESLVDVGCNIGYFTCLFAIENQSASVVSVDANPRMIDRTRINVQNNKILNVTMLANGLAAASGEMTLHIPKVRHSRASFAYKPGEDTGVALEAVEVSVRTLSSVLCQYNLQNCFVKIDTEGFEYAVLSGLDTEEVPRVAAVLIEANYRNLARAGVTLTQLLEFSWLESFIWFEVDDHQQSIAPVKRDEIIGREKINSNLLFIRPALAQLAGFTPG